MNVGELFVNLGVKGSEKSVGAISNVTKGLGEAKSMSIEAKAAILGMLYAFERYLTASGNLGTQLINFNALTGLSTKELQQWQYAMTMAGGTADDITGSVKNIQKAMAQIDLGKGVPEGLLMLSQAAGGIDFSKKDDPFYIMAAVQKALKNIGSGPRSKAIANYLATSLGINENVIAGMQRGAFNQKSLSQAPILSENTLQALDRSRAAWSKLGITISQAFAKFNAAHGQQLVKDITMLIEPVVKLAAAFTKLAETLHVFEGIGWVFKQLGESLKEITGWLEGSRSFWGEELDKKGKVVGEKSSIGEFLRSMFSPGAKAGPEDRLGLPGFLKNPKSISPSVSPGTPAPGSTQNININQNLNFQHDGKDHKKTADSTKKAHQEAFRQFPQGRVS